MPKTRGFTLIELLVVVAIIAILSLIGMTVFGGIQQRARDATRRSDIDAIGSAFEAHYTVGSTTAYPIPQGEWFNSGAIPKDPQGSNYFWNGSQSVPTAAKPKYVVCAQLENNYGNSSTQGTADFTFTNASGNSANHYCRKNLL